MERPETYLKRWSIEYIDEEGDMVLYHFDGSDPQLFEELRSLMVLGFKPTAYNLTPQIESNVKCNAILDTSRK